DTADISVGANGRAEVRVAVSYPSLPIAEARTRAVGEKVFVEGIVLNTLPTFGDSSMYIIDASAAIRVIRIPHSEATVGDSVRVLGIVGTRDGQPVLTDAGGVILSRSNAPPPELLSTATARTASSGTLDASLARITGATIVGSEVTSTQDLLLTVDDGSGPLEVLVAQSTGIPTADLNACAILDATGILAPDPSGSTWRLKPRSATDVTVDYPSVAIRDARDQPVRSCIFVYGVALHAWTTFGDSTLHVTGGTGAIRATRVRETPVAVGDSIRLLGLVTTGTGGQRVLSNAQVARIYQPAVVQPVPTVLETAEAASAGGDGRYDAALVRVDTATILSASTTPSGDRLLTVDDGSGPLEILI